MPWRSTTLEGRPLLKPAITQAEVEHALRAIVARIDALDVTPEEHAKTIVEAPKVGGHVLTFLTRNYNAHQVMDMALAVLNADDPQRCAAFNALLSDARIMRRVARHVGQVLVNVRKICARRALERKGAVCSA